MTGQAAELEALLRQALAPVEPPADLADRLEVALVNLTELAADELESWELGAMRDPRNWVRPGAALVVGSAAGAALVVMRARHRRHAAQQHGLRIAAEHALRDVYGGARRLLGDARSR
jgi:hypothetical protein